MVDEAAAHEAKGLPMTSITSNYTEARFSKDDSALLLIDHQSGIMQLNHDPTRVEFGSAATALAKVGKIFNLPTIITTSYETGPNGPIIQELLDLHPNAQLLDDGPIGASFVARCDYGR